MRQTLCRELQQFRDRFEVPVRVGRVHVPEIRRQFWELALDIDTCPIPRDQGLSRESMPEILNPWPVTVPAPTGTSLGRSAAIARLESMISLARSAGKSPQ